MWHLDATAIEDAIRIDPSSAYPMSDDGCRAKLFVQNPVVARPFDRLTGGEREPVGNRRASEREKSGVLSWTSPVVPNMGT